MPWTGPAPARGHTTTTTAAIAAGTRSRGPWRRAPALPLTLKVVSPRAGQGLPGCTGGWESQGLHLADSSSPLPVPNSTMGQGLRPGEGPSSCRRERRQERGRSQERRQPSSSSSEKQRFYSCDRFGGREHPQPKPSLSSHPTSPTAGQEPGPHPQVRGGWLGVGSPSGLSASCYPRFLVLGAVLGHTASCAATCFSLSFPSCAPFSPSAPQNLDSLLSSLPCPSLSLSPPSTPTPRSLSPPPFPLIHHPFPLPSSSPLLVALTSCTPRPPVFTMHCLLDFFYLGFALFHFHVGQWFS